MEHNHDIYLQKLQTSNDAKQRLGLASLVTFVIFFVELVGGFLSGSLALIADAGHMATDVFALLLGYAAAWFSRLPATPHRTYGFYRVEILAALANGVLLFGVSILVCYEAIRRLSETQEIHTQEMMLYGAIGLAANIVSALLLHRNSASNVNVRAAYLHVLSDLAGSVGVIIGAALIALTGLTVIDSAISLLISALIVRSAWGIITEAVDVLLESVPRDLDITSVDGALRQMNHVRDLHDLHVWSITSGVNALSCHVTVDEYDCSETLILGINAMLKEKFNIEHVTVQLETANVKAAMNHSEGCVEDADKKERVAENRIAVGHSHHAH
jgi:cobalt-zinc-cadmium efflux system protein